MYSVKNSLVPMKCICNLKLKKWKQKIHIYHKASRVQLNLKATNVRLLFWPFPVQASRVDFPTITITQPGESSWIDLVTINLVTDVTPSQPPHIYACTSRCPSIYNSPTDRIERTCTNYKVNWFNPHGGPFWVLEKCLKASLFWTQLWAIWHAQRHSLN